MPQINYNAPAALILSSGFLAAQFAVKHLANLGEVCYAPATHPAVWSIEPPAIEISFAQWANEAVKKINESTIKNWVLISNSMNNLYPERYDFSFVERIDQTKEVVLLIDDSHGIGINNNGLSVLSSFSAPKHVKVLVIASMAKALGVDAGLILGDEKLISQIKEGNDFLGASPPTAAGLYAFMQGEKIYDQELAKLQLLTSTLANVLSGKDDWHFIANFPVFFSKNADLSANLFEKQILVSSFPYPDKDGPMVNRIVLSSWHNSRSLNKLITTLT